MSINWLEAWDNDNPIWHRGTVCPALERHKDKLIANKENVKLFVPLCGKSDDLLFLSKLGCRIVGVEYSEKGVQQFFKENNLSFVVKYIPDVEGSVYENSENNIKIYCIDFFKFNSVMEKDFDGIWDCGALEAIEPELREKYVTIIKSISLPGTRYLLETADRSDGKGPPHYVSIEEMKFRFGLADEPEQVDYEKAVPILKEMGCDGVFHYFFQIK